MKTYSLRSRLTRRIIIPTFIAAAITLFIGFLFAWHEIEEVYDAEMAHTAKLLLQITHYEMDYHPDHGDIILNEVLTERQHKYEKYTAYRIWHKGELLTRSWHTEGFGKLNAPPGFSDQIIDGHHWRVFVYIADNDHLKIEVAQRFTIRLELSGQLVSSLILPGVIFIPTITLIILVAVRRALMPVVQISTDVDRRNSDDLSPIRNKHIPIEISPLIHALNRLFERLTDSFRRERDFTDHAAHELRTPLAAMKTQTQVLAREAEHYPELKEGLKNLHDSTNRATQLVEQMLYFSRLQNQPLPLNPIDLSQTLEDATAAIIDLTQAKGQQLEIQIAADIKIQGHNDAIDILLSNLLENAVKYTPPGGHIQVSLDSHALLEIKDDGPGLTDEQKLRVFNRFYRVDNTGQRGSGLGLSIAEWIAKEHRVEIKLKDNEPKGLCVKIQWSQLS